MAWPLGAGLELWLLWSCMILGNGLHVQILGGRSDQQSRQKREWIVPPAVITEEQDNSRRNPIARIQSDFQNSTVITYTISGQGVTEPPYGLFVMNGKTGELNITGKVDREQTPVLLLKGFAINQNGDNIEKPLDLRIKVLDINDNSPVFSEEVFVGSVEELCDVGTVVMRISATDADEPNTLNSKIAFRIISQEPSEPPAFMINKATGVVQTTTFQLDREEHSSFSLIVEAKDRDGAAIGLGKASTVKFKLIDVNDNIPVLEKATYEGSVKENMANMEIMRLKVFDRDEEFTDNWLAQFAIVSGNEGGYFRIETDSQTNEGILTLVKEVNYEELQTMNLNIVVSNKAAYHKSIISRGYQAQPIPVKINVINVKEGPVFKPQTLVIKANRTMKLNQVIGSFQAFDEDTGKIAERIRYSKLRDVENWFKIDSKTAEIKLIKIPRFDSSSLVNGSYIATILAVTEDIPSKTATGTIAIQVQNVNFHCPTITTRATTICADAKFANISVEDHDPHPNGGPFTFSVIDEPERMSDKWVIGQVDGSRAQLVSVDAHPGSYEIPILVKDNQGLSCADRQIVHVSVCTCGKDGVCVGQRIVGSSVVLGPAAVALIILALLLLLLLPLLLLMCRAGSGATKGFAAIPDNSEEMLRNWNNEGAAPENKAFLNLIAPPALDNSASSMGVGAAAVGVGAAATQGGGSSSMMKEHYNSMKVTDGRWEEQRALLSGAGYGGMESGGASAMAAGGGMAARGTMVMGSGGMMGAGGTMAMETGGAVNEDFLRSYFNDKYVAFADEDEGQLVKDCLLVYSQEEEGGSTHGSVGCCSFIEDDFDDHFLDDLGDKFKTLAEICVGKRMGTVAKQHSSQVLKDTVDELDVHGLSSKHNYSSGSSYQLPETTKDFGAEIVTEELVTETAFASRAGLQPAKPIPDPMVSSSVVVTETSYGATPSTVILDPQLNENVVVTERVLAPASSLQEMLEIPHGVFQDLPDSKYVVVRERERVLVPSSNLQASLSIPNLSEGQNVVVTSSSPGWQAAGMRTMTEPTIYSGTDRQEHVLISDPVFHQASTEEVFPPGSSLNKSSRLTKYSSVQYTRS
ncbi:PREDICTED: desmoglein-2 [Gekko japonicus]|uniref:Desmoglein-2 n=1 Tax=Gekko japonicus TaxID=146911 RepID=A0ABM1K8K5_GEKJA|nr:PREDICTED: desmoglein-2 [Gekko japonicus]